MNDKRNILLYVIIGLLVVIIIFLGILLLKREIKSDDADEKKNKQIRILIRTSVYSFSDYLWNISHNIYGSHEFPKMGWAVRSKMDRNGKL